MRSLVKWKIQQAFPVCGIPAASIAIQQTHSVEHLHEILGGRFWNSLTPTQYRHCSDGFCLLTVVGLHYYLPGYMIAELDDPGEADVVAEYWTYSLGGDSEFYIQRMKSLGELITLDQMDAIALWMGYYVNTYDKNKYTQRSYVTLEQWPNKALHTEPAAGRKSRKKRKPPAR